MGSAVLQFPKTQILGDTAAPPAGDQPPSILIVTVEPEPFIRAFDGKLGFDVFVETAAQAVFNLLPSLNCTRIYADFRPLDAPWRGVRWTGQRMLDEIKRTEAYAAIPVFVMTNNPQDHLRIWLEGRGAAGIVPRDPLEIARELRLAESNAKRRSASRVSAAPAALFTEIDAVFRRFAGPLADVHLAPIRKAMSHGDDLITMRRGYIEALANALMLPEHRTEFLRQTNGAAGVAPIAQDSWIPPPTSQLDPWVVEVNRLFAEFAGAFGANQITTRAMRRYATEPSFGRQEYLQALTEALTISSSRAGFVSALARSTL